MGGEDVDVDPRSNLTEAEKAAGFASSHSPSFPALLSRLGVSVAASTYQSGRLILLRAEGDRLNTHLRVFESPMGLAVSDNRFVVGDRYSVHDYRNHPGVAVKAEPRGAHDACYLHRSTHVTGGLAIHEVVDVGGEVVIVNTLFSCLCTLDGAHSFVPTWRPPFISELGPGDRCHLNGVAVRDGAVRYVSALGVSDQPGGWRPDRPTGGVVMEVPSGEVLLGGLCMPHSPRWHEGALWVLESGTGSLCRASGVGGVEVVATVPGFARGLAFHGSYAFVGLSLRRDTLPEDIPIIQMEDRACGVWVVDIRDGSTVGFVRFTGVVQEIFDVQIVPHRFPEVAEPEDPLVATSFTVPDADLAEVPEVLRSRPA